MNSIKIKKKGENKHYLLLLIRNVKQIRNVSIDNKLISPVNFFEIKSKEIHLRCSFSFHKLNIVCRE